MSVRLRSIAAVSLLFLSGVGGLCAQTYAVDRGVWQPGGSVSFSRLTAGSGGNAILEISVAPSVGYFVRPGLSLGMRVPLGYFHSSSQHSWQYGLAPRLTYYLRGGEHRFYPYVSGEVGFVWGRISSNGSLTARDESWGWQASGGGVQLISRNVGLTGELYYSYSRITGTQVPSGSKTTFSSSMTGLRFGVAFFVY